MNILKVNIRQLSFLFLFVGFLLGGPCQAQYVFSDEIDLSCTSVKSQAKTGTCWSFSTVSFLESELIRMGQVPMDLSEMYIVRQIYQDKARNYFLRQGKANFSEGSLAHDVIRAMEMGGLMLESDYSGLMPGQEAHNHGDLVKGLKGFMDGILNSRNPNGQWMVALNGIMDAYLGAVPPKVTYEGKQLSPQAFAQNLPLKAEDYLSFSSYSHHPYYVSFILEIPDNYSNGSYYNLPIDEMQATVDHALQKGFTVSWDGDVGEKGFSAQNGLAILPQDEKRPDLFDVPGEELVVTQELRQATFMSFSTTDDHLMHIVGTAKDQAGNRYYKIKNSWGPVGPYDGFLYMSEAYFRLKTVGVLVHKDSVPKDILDKCLP